MPTAPEFKAPFLPECYYHFVCKSIDGILLFKEDADYIVFLHRFHQFTNDFLDVWSYSLLPNHTHHVVKIKSLATVIDNINKISTQTLAMQSLLSDQQNHACFDTMIERQMNSFLVSYANYTNNKYRRKGGLFQKPFRRIEISDDNHLQQAIIYVHANAQKHKIVSDFKQHPHNSYKSILTSDSTFVDVTSLVNFFEGHEKFMAVHKSQVEFYYKNDWPGSTLE